MGEVLWLLRNFAWRRVVVHCRHFEKNITPVFKVQAVQEDYLTLEDGNDVLSRKVGNQLPIYSAQLPRSARVSTTQRWKPETSQITKYGRTPLIQTLVIWITNYASHKFVENSKKLTCLETTGYRTKYSTVQHYGFWILKSGVVERFRCRCIL
jgi:hypothetical protein